MQYRFKSTEDSGQVIDGTPLSLCKRKYPRQYEDFGTALLINRNVARQTVLENVLVKD